MNSFQTAKNSSIETFDLQGFIASEIFRGLEPDSYMSVSDWADAYRTLSSKSAAEPGRWRTKRTPYLKEIMDCLSPRSTNGIPQAKNEKVHRSAAPSAAITGSATSFTRLPVRLWPSRRLWKWPSVTRASVLIR